MALIGFYVYRTSLASSSLWFLCLGFSVLLGFSLVIKGRDLHQTEVKCVSFHAIFQWKPEKNWLFLFDWLIKRRIRGREDVKFIFIFEIFAGTKMQGGLQDWDFSLWESQRQARRRNRLKSKRRCLRNLPLLSSISCRYPLWLRTKIVKFVCILPLYL